MMTLFLYSIKRTMFSVSISIPSKQVKLVSVRTLDVSKKKGKMFVK